MNPSAPTPLTPTLTLTLQLGLRLQIRLRSTHDENTPYTPPYSNYSVGYGAQGVFTVELGHEWFACGAYLGYDVGTVAQVPVVRPGYHFTGLGW